MAIPVISTIVSTIVGIASIIVTPGISFSLRSSISLSNRCGLGFPLLSTPVTTISMAIISTVVSTIVGIASIIVTPRISLSFSSCLSYRSSLSFCLRSSISHCN